MGDQRLSGSRRGAAAWRGRVPVLVALALAALAACKRGGPPPLPLRVVQVQVAGAIDPAVTGPSGAGAEAALNEEALQAAARRGLQRAGINYAATGEGQPGDFKLRLELLLQRAPTQTGVEAPPLRVLCAGQLRARAGSALTSDEQPTKQPAPELARLSHVVAVERAPKAGEGEAAWSELAQRVTEETAATLGEQLRLLGQPASALIQVAGDRGRDESVRGIAVQLLGLRKERSAVPILVALIKEKEKEPGKEKAPTGKPARPPVTEPGALRDLAIGALVEIGDPSAVRPLLDVMQLGDRVEVGKLLEAVAALGGDEARRFLEFVSVSHSDEKVRAEAKTALGHLTKRHGRLDGGS